MLKGSERSVTHVALGDPVQREFTSLAKRVQAIYSLFASAHWRSSIYGAQIDNAKIPPSHRGYEDFEVRIINRDSRWYGGLLNAPAAPLSMAR